MLKVENVALIHCDAEVQIRRFRCGVQMERLNGKRGQQDRSIPSGRLESCAVSDVSTTDPEDDVLSDIRCVIPNSLQVAGDNERI